MEIYTLLSAVFAFNQCENPPHEGKFIGKDAKALTRLVENGSVRIRWEKYDKFVGKCEIYVRRLNRGKYASAYRKMLYKLSGIIETDPRQLKLLSNHRTFGYTQKYFMLISMARNIILIKIFNVNYFVCVCAFGALRLREICVLF